MVQIKSNAEIYCDEFSGKPFLCDYISLRKTGACCGSCPLTNFGEWFVNDLIASLPSDPAEEEESEQ